MRSLAVGGAVGIIVGTTAGRFMSVLPPVWGAIVIFFASALFFFWAARSLRELRERGRIIESLLAQLSEARSERLRDWK